jgi:hypothetical protein
MTTVSRSYSPSITPPGGTIALVFSHELLDRIQSSRANVDAFVEGSLLCQAEQACQNHSLSVREKQRNIDVLREDLEEVQRKRGLTGDAFGSQQNDGVESKKSQLLERQNEIRDELNRLRQSTKSVTGVLSQLNSESAQHEEKAKIAREKKELLHVKRSVKVEDLTRGLVHYSKMGLAYETDLNCMWFKFTQMDPTDPDREFKFSLTIQDGQIYVVEECIPTLPDDEVAPHVEKLNASNNDDIPTLLRSMRKLFRNSVV